MKKLLALALGLATLLLMGNAYALPIAQVSDLDEYGLTTGLIADYAKDGVPDTNNKLEHINNGDYWFADWMELGKYDWPDADGSGGGYSGNSVSLVVTPASSQSSSGTFSFDSSAWDIYSDMMIVLKSGAIKVDDPNSDKDLQYKWFAYLLKDGIYQGDWNYPMQKNISHLSVYGRGRSIPEPANMLLLGTGLLGLAGISRRKFKK